MKLVFFVTHHSTVKTFVVRLADYLAESGFEVTVMADGADSEELRSLAPRVTFCSIKIEREPAPFSDLRSLVRCISLLKRIEPTIITYATPKASLIGSIAAWVTDVPVRIYQIWGLRLDTATGWNLVVLTRLERLTARLSTVLFANSHSLAQRYASLGLSGRSGVEVIASGSSHGVNVEYFSRAAVEQLRADRETRAFLEGQGSLFTIGFVGRLHPDKGLRYLVGAVEQCRSRGLDLRLLLVGDDEGARAHQMVEEAELSECVHFSGRQDDVRPYYAAMDVLVLPTLREGFPNVVLEAAAMETPAIVTDATGAIDSVLDGNTGLVVPARDSGAIAEAMEMLIRNPAIALRMGRAAREWVVAEFDERILWPRIAEAFIQKVMELPDDRVRKCQV